jgi:hypothetical protein
MNTTAEFVQSNSANGKNKKTAFCGIAPCSLVEVDRRFRGSIPQKAVIFILASMKT